MPSRHVSAVICGAGIAGISVAYRLAVHHRVKGVVLIDERPPLTLTSDKSSEAYRNWWPGPDGAMIRLMNRSIDLLEELARDSDNRILMNRRGYLWATADRSRVDAMLQSSAIASAQGAGPVRIHAGRAGDPEYVPAPTAGFEGAPDGADLILDRELLRRTFPFLNPDSVAALHTRRCGWLSGQQLGMEQFERARAAGVELVEGRVEAVATAGGRVTGVGFSRLGMSETLTTNCFVNAAGPHLARVGRLLGLELPVFSERHLKVSIEDTLGVVPRNAPLVVWEDRQNLAWSEEERQLLAGSRDLRLMLAPMPAGVHMRPEGMKHLLLLWPYHTEPVTEVYPVPVPQEYAEVCLRGMARVVPGLARYLDRLPQPWVDGGYYTRTVENRPLVGPLPVEGAFVHGALSGFGLMASSATAELLALHITGGRLPPDAAAFHPARYEDPDYLRSFEDWSDGQL